MDKVLMIEGKKIFYRVIGNGMPVMLVHGFGEDGSVWWPKGAERNVSILEDKSVLEKVMFIIPDLPGSGQSGIVADMSIEGMAEIMKIIADDALAMHGKISGSICVIGHSMGGYISLAFAEKYPKQLNGLGLFHSTAYADNEEKKQARRKGIDFINEHGAFEFLKTSTPNLFSAKSRDERPELIDEQLEGLRNFSGDALVLYYRAMMQRPDRTVVLVEATVPVLFIMGEQDSAVPMKDMLEQCHLPGKAYIHTLQQSGHMGMLEEAVKANQILKNYILDLYPKYNTTDRPDQ
ncbi:MAG TPA: alpha/beta hydrolase [Chitinophagaceae bacterium]